MKATSKIIFDDDEDLDVQAAALQSYLLSLEARSVKLGAKAADDLKFYTIETSIKESGANATFFMSKDKLNKALAQKVHLITASGQICYTTHAGKRHCRNLN